MDHAKDTPNDNGDQFDFDAEFSKLESMERCVWFTAYWSKTHIGSGKSPEGFSQMHPAGYAGFSRLLLKSLDSENSLDI